MNSNAYPSSSYPQPQQNINPAMLSRSGGYNNNMMMPGGGGAINPAQLINGMGQNQNQSMTLNPAPAQLLHQQQQQQQMMMNGMGMMGMGVNMMGGMGNMNNMNIGVGGGGINPASLSSPANNIPMHHQPQAQPPMPNMGGMMMNQPMSPNPMAVLNSMGITREQLAAMPQQERQMKISAAMQAVGMFPERQLQQHQQQQVVSPQAAFFDRPSSSASSHSHSHGQQMMPPPPPRPPTAQGMQQQGHPSRPGTAMSHHSPTIPGPQMQQQQQRPPSRVASAGAGEFTQQNMYNPNMNGYTTKQATPQPQPQPPTPQPYQQHGSPPPMPGSPYRGNGNNMMQQKKKMESPRMGGTIGLPPQVMGPPGLPRTVSSEGMNGYAMQQQQQQRQSPRPGSSMGMSMQGQQQRQGSMPPPMSMQQQQQQQGGMRQGSAPPAAAQQQQQQKVEMRMSVPPAPTAVPLQPAPVPQAIAPSASSSSSTSAVQPPTPAAAVAATGASTPGPGPVIPQLPPLPANVTLNPAVTRVTPVPLLDSVKHIPPLSESEIADIQGWMKVDKEYEGVFRKMKERMGEEAREAFGLGKAAWWQKGYPGGNFSRYRRGREVFDVRYPRRRGEGGRKKVGRREGLKLPRQLDADAANLPEQLVPIRLEFDVEHHKMRDTFIWNLNDPIVTPEVFAQSIVDDYALAPSYHGVIMKHIQDQLSDYKSHTVGYDGDGDVSSRSAVKGEVEVFKGVIGEEEGKWWEGWRKRVRYDEVGARRKRRKMEESINLDEGEDGMGDVEEEEGEDEKPLPLEEFRIEEDKLHEEMRILIKLDIIVGSMKLDDQFEWDLDNPDASPEQFAAVYTQELGLGGEFQTAIAHSIREQVQTYQKSLFLVGHPSDGSLVQDDELRQSFLPSLATGARSVNEVQSFTPLLNYLSDGEIERNEKEREKDLNKRRKRNTRGRRGVALPDREPIRTYRTPAIGFPELDPATLALAAAANAPVSRRAAAAAASLTIANMVASENGERFTPQMMPAVIPQPPPSAAKEKKPKGLFKPPPFSAQVLRPRAQVVAPTPSTAADVSTLPAPLENDPPPPIPTVAAPPDSKAQKAITAKRAKELEREAKEREFVDGQHPNIIDGVWHCSNCGCPESIAIGRRKGPLGDKSQCGTCGKFWHRHRRPRPVEYNSDPDFHSNLRKVEEAAKAPGAKKKGAAAALRAQSTATATTPVQDLSEPQTPARSNGDAEAPSRQSPANNERDDDRAVSPMSTASSASEAPLAQKVKMNGSSHKFSTPAKASTSKPISTPVKVEATPKHVTPAPVSSASAPDGANKSAGESVSANSTKSTWPPEWLSEAMKAMQTKYPHDRFEVILRKVGSSSTPEWRIKCSDCPGKLYTPGPGETLSNYEVHLKNRLHRQRVNDRVNAANS